MGKGLGLDRRPQMLPLYTYLAGCWGARETQDDPRGAEQSRAWWFTWGSSPVPQKMSPQIPNISSSWVSAVAPGPGAGAGQLSSDMSPFNS